MSHNLIGAEASERVAEASAHGRVIRRARATILPNPMLEAGASGSGKTDRFYFHIDYGEYSPDTVGVELSSTAAARAVAVDLIGQLLRDQSDAFCPKPEVAVTVTDDAGRKLLTLSVLEAGYQ